MAKTGPTGRPGAGAAAAPETAKVFLSYSRRDAAFADELVEGLKACGFEAYIDREDIAPGEAWETRLSGLIAEADTVVYVISPHSVTSEQCHWEVSETLRMSKRLLPVVWAPVPEAQMPKELARLNFVFFDGGRSFAKGLSDLAGALRVDVGWIREHSRLGGLARRWDTRGRPEEALLRGEELDHARDWAAARPPSAPELTDLHSDYIAASLAAREAAERDARARRRGAVVVSAMVAMAMTVLAGAASWQWWQASRALERAELAETVATGARLAAEDAKKDLEAANLRLSADIAVRIPPSGKEATTVAGGWFPLAAKYSGAIARVERLDDEGLTVGIQSGFLLRGDIVRAGDAGVYLLVPAYRAPNAGIMPNLLPRALPVDVAGQGDVREDGSLDPMAEDRAQMAILVGGAPVGMKAVFPVLGEDAAVNGAERIWRTPEHLGGVAPFELWALEGAAPFGARPLETGDVSCEPLNGTAVAGSKLALYGIGDALDDGTEVTLFLSTLIGADDPYAISYQHTTTLGSMGAPVFQLSTGDVLGVHLGSSQGETLDSPRTGYGISLALIIEEIRQELEPGDAGPLPLLCGE